jgi:cytochrome bd-type quinol oxidase subunit 1
LTYGNWDTAVKGLDQFDENTHPTNISGLYYAYHIMVGLGTVFIGLMSLALQLFRKAIWNQMDFMGFVLHDAISLYRKYYWMVYLRVGDNLG